MYAAVRYTNRPDDVRRRRKKLLLQECKIVTSHQNVDGNEKAFS